MRAIHLNVDVEGLKNNGLHVYKVNEYGDCMPVENAHFIITDSNNLHDDITDITPKQYNNILFFETLKAFRR